MVLKPKTEIKKAIGIKRSPKNFLVAPPPRQKFHWVICVRDTQYFMFFGTGHQCKLKCAGYYRKYQKKTNVRYADSEEIEAGRVLRNTKRDEMVYLYQPVPTADEELLAAGVKVLPEEAERAYKKANARLKWNKQQSVKTRIKLKESYKQAEIELRQKIYKP